MAGIVCSAYYSEPDCSSSVDWPANMTNVIMNGANGYAGLCAKCWAIIEYANEIWNGTSQTSYINNIGAQPATVGKVGCGTGSIGGYYVLNAELIANDILNSGYTKGRVAMTMGGQVGVPSVGISRATGNNGTAPFFSCQPPPPASVPIQSLFTFVNVAPYFDAPSNNNVNIGTLAATWASDVNSFGFNSSQAIADLAPLVNSMANDTSTGGTSTIPDAKANITPVATAIAPYGQKYVIGYEGWWETNVNPNSVSWGLITGWSCASGTVTITATMFSGSYASPMAIQGFSISGYNGVFTTTQTGSNPLTFTYSVGGSCLGTPSSTNFQGWYGYVQQRNDAYMTAAKDSSAWGTAYVGYLNWAASTANVGMPGFFIQDSLDWGVTWPDTFGATNTEGGGNNPSWSAIGTANQGRAN